jgi:hypothetical protein
MKKTKKTIVEEMHEHGIVCVDVPLLIRLLEYARESIEDDVDIHFLAARMIRESEDGKVLTMEDYKTLCS